MKIRGNRLETGEVESALLAIEGVREAVVTTHHQGLETRLIAYVVSDDKPPPAITWLRRSLAERLPDPMIPAAFVLLETMPVTSNGKIDRRALRQLEQPAPETLPNYVAPRTQIEETLAKIWAAATGLTRVGVHDNFFELGGHSLTAIQIVAQIIKDLHLELPLPSLLRCPTVAEMAVLVNECNEKQLGREEIHRILSDLEALTEDEAGLLVPETGSKQLK